jgi:hypothetical protein
MRRYKLDSRQGLCNLFAEYISNEISENGKYETMISVSDCQSLILIKGYTKKEEIVDVKEIVNKFISKYWADFSFTDLQKVSTLDMVSFGEEKKFKEKKLKFHFERGVQFPKFDMNVVDSPIVTSTFPYGFSKNYLKNLYLYLEHIVYNIQDHFGYTFIELTVEEDYRGDVEIIEILSDSVYPASRLKSIIYDNFEMNVSEINDLIKEQDLVKELSYSIHNSPWFVIKENSEFRVI